MYVLKNSLNSIIRNKGRNILIGIIILVISAASTVTLAIRNTAENLVKNYEDSAELTASISFNREQMKENFKGGEDAKKENIENFNNIESFTVADVENYGNSEYLKNYYYVYSTSLNSDTLSKATDSMEIDVENTETTEGNNSKGDRPEGGDGATTIITKSKETFQNARNLTGDFELDGYSSYDAMTDFVDGTLKITSGEMISNFDEFECAINEELASLNSISVGDTITLKNPTTNITYDFKVVGIYEDNSGMDDSVNMYSKSANKIITGSKVVEKLVADDSTLGTNVTPTFVLNSEDVIEEFTNEVKEKGLNDNYTINTNLNEIQNATESIDNVKTFATTFLIITLIISAIVLFVINMINIRERKYEIGVYRTIGISKLKLTEQFVLELLIVTIISLSLGAILGGMLSKPVGNKLLENEISESKSNQEQVQENFGKPGGMENEHKMGGMKEVQAFDSIDAVVDIKVIAELLGIGIVLTLVSSLASMISIQKFSPLTILKERS